MPPLDFCYFSDVATKCGITYWRKICVFLEKRPLTRKFSKFCSIRIHRDTDRPIVMCSNFVKFGRLEIREVVRYLPNKKVSPGSPALATVRIAPKILRGQPESMYLESSRFHPNRFTFGGVIANCVNTVKMLFS